MATYEDFEKFVKSEFGAGSPKDAPPGFTALKVPIGSRSQIVFFMRAGNDKVGETVKVISFVGQIKGAKLIDALAKAGNLVVGGLVIVADHLALSHTILLDNVDDNEISVPLFAIAFSADALEKEFIGGDNL